MQPWQQQSYGYNSFNGGQNPQQTGNGSFMQSQPTGFPGQGQPQSQPGQQQRPGGNLSFLNAPPPSSQFNPGCMAPQMTGYPGAGGGGGMMPQQTGYGGMMSQPTGMMGQQTGMSGMMGQRTGMMPQQTGMMPQQTGYGGGGLMSQPTGFGGGLRAQPTGYQDPRLQSMMQSFMPSNVNQPFASSGMPQFNSTPQNQPLTHTFQTLLQNPSVKTPKVPWTLSKQEKKDYDQIFRAWEKGDGFVSGETAREVFGQSGLNQDDLIKIWTLSDVDNRGKLNLPEFHVAMGLVYRALNGNDIPDKLPEEMVPPSMRDIDTTVSFMRDLLKHESTNRSNTSSPAYGGAPSAAQSKDAVAYKHDDTRSGSTYKPSSRHIDRKSVRYAGEEPGAEIGDLRRQLQNTSALLDKSNADYERKSDEDEQLEQEVDDLKYRVKRLQEDIDYVSKGRRTAEKDEERRKLEREVLFLMHEKLPELERRQQQREEERKMEERAGVRARDRRNDTHGRYDDRDRESRDDHAWLRGSYDRERRGSREQSRDRDYYRRDERDRDYERRDSRDRDREYRPRSPPASRTPPPAPPPAPAAAAPPPAAPPKPTSAAAVPNTKNMTPEERTAFIREQAQRRIQDRLRALGVESAPSDTPTVDKSVEERLAQEKKEAEEKSRTADEEQKARETARQARLAGGTAPKEETPKSPEPKSILKGNKAAPPPPTSRAKQPPKPPAPKSAPAAPPAPSAPAVPAPTEEDEEEVEFRRREEAIKKAKEDRRRRLAELEREEEEERKREEEAASSARKAKSPTVEAPSAPSAPAPPPAPPAPGGGNGGYNPFRKPGAASTPAAAPVSSPGGGFNPFFKPQAAKSPSPAATPVTSPPPAPAPPPPPSAPIAPPAPAAPAQARSPPPADDGWESIHEKEADSDEDSSDDDDYAKSRDNRRNLASALFGGLTGGSSSSPTTSRPGSAAPKAPAALKNLGGGDPAAGRGALLSAIQGGARLKKAQTVVKTAAASGKVIGDAAPPAHISETPREYAPEPKEDDEPAFQGRNENRQSVDWYAGLAADQSHPAQAQMEALSLETTREEPEPTTSEPAAAEEDELADFDLTQSLRVRTLYPYEGQRDVDLTFKEDTVIVAHPAKDASSPWWYGLVVDGGAKGWFPHDYVEEIRGVQARALYSYAGTTEEELPFAEGDELVIVDHSDADWWKAEKAGVIFIVPASYLEIIGSDGVTHARNIEVAAPVAAVPREHENHSVSSAVQMNMPREVELASTTNSPQWQNRSLAPPVDLTPASSSSLLSPIPPAFAQSQGRPRSSTVASHTSHASSYADADQEDGGESSDDSVLSWWSSDDDGSDDEGAKSGRSAAAGKADGKKTDADKQKKEEDRVRREEERLKMLSSAGLQLKREAPALPGGGHRRAAPGVPKARKQRRKAPAVPQLHRDEGDHGETDGPQAEGEGGKGIDTLDAYARYEQFLAESKNKPSTPVPPPLPLSATSAVFPKGSPQGSTASVPLSPTASTGTGRTGTGADGAAGGGRLSGFFSRMMQNTGSAGAPGERRATISGPIRMDESGRTTPDGSGGGGGAGAGGGGGEMGKTWGSLVDPGVLASMSDRERKRQEAIYEFIQTESTYNRDLQLIVQVFYASLLDILDEKAQTVIFANVEDILMANIAFLSDLEERQRVSRLYVDTVGDIVRGHMGNMDVYTSQAGQLLQSLRSNDPTLNAKLETISQTNPVVRGLDLSHFLLIPMQRITRYPLLLKQIIHYTDPDQDLNLLEQGLRTVETIVGRINESVRENESAERLRALSEDLWIGGEGRLDLTAPTAYQGPRKMIKEGVVLKAKSGRKLTLVLCNDILVLIDSRNLYRMPIPLFECTVRRGRDEVSFALKVEYRRGGDTIGLKATSPREAQEWRHLIEEARLKAVDARMVSGSGGMRGF